MRRRRALVRTALAAVAMVLVVAGCGGAKSTGGATTSAGKTFTSPAYAFSISYDPAVLPKLERVSSTSGELPKRPADWSGFYATNLLLSSAADMGALNVGVVNPEQDAGVFVSASRRESKSTIASQIEAMGQGTSNLLVAGDVFSSGPTPTPVTVGGLKGFKVVVPSRGRDYSLSGLDPGLLKHTDYVVYGLFGPTYQYSICTFVPSDRAAKLQPSLDAVVESFTTSK